MKKSGGVFLVCVICLVALCSMAFLGKDVIRISNKTILKKTVMQKDETALLTSDFILENERISGEAGQSATPQNDLAAAAKNVAGKIKEQFFSPFAAQAVYNNICVKNKTSFNLNIKQELAEPFELKVENKQEPLVLIVHTHTTEAYMKEDKDYYTDTDYSRTTDNKENMAAVGEEFANQLVKAGIGVIHDTTVHDYPSYSGSYSRSAQTVTENLKKYPSIKIVLDIHRDAISAGGGDKVKPVAVINGKKAAQIMLVMGAQDGNADNFPNWRQNLRLALRYQQILEAKYSGLARALSLNPKRYNQHLCSGAMLIEVGSDANTLKEAKYAAGMAGEALACLVNTLCTDNE